MPKWRWRIHRVTWARTAERLHSRRRVNPSGPPPHVGDTRAEFVQGDVAYASPRILQAPCEPRIRRRAELSRQWIGSPPRRLSERVGWPASRGAQKRWACGCRGRLGRAAEDLRALRLLLDGSVITDPGRSSIGSTGRSSHAQSFRIARQVTSEPRIIAGPYRRWTESLTWRRR
jgi:hypothetical protein